MVQELVYVIHEHHARKLHWDLRLEMNGVLRSWVLPKGVLLNPGIKHLAIQVEDHDLSYADFEGKIPEGYYGAGRVVIWDKGFYELKEQEEHKIEVKIHGNKIKGEYMLLSFRPEEKAWLIFKRKNLSK